MFIKVVVADTVLLHPQDFPQNLNNTDLDKHLDATVRQKYELKVIQT